MLCGDGLGLADFSQFAEFDHAVNAGHPDPGIAGGGGHDGLHGNRPGRLQNLLRVISNFQEQDLTVFGEEFGPLGLIIVRHLSSPFGIRTP